ncbi:helix-turn-helix transcriptional regulator [Stenotrophomonas acidaminiphila]|uniref:helix-turn-helix transcriptional regulator n=1 Tax=Stenotrophomonas acidaminiphila TaxID=128780 RepID=UPI0028AC0213|nr:helix-turn-helix transcriptional regulator [Stenotrophomonas acidaminiphila]
MLDMIGDRLKELRLEHNLGQPEFGAIAGTTKQYVWRLENGLNKKPNPEYIQRWASHFQVRMEWITSGKMPKEAASAAPLADPEASQPQRLDAAIILAAVRLASGAVTGVGLSHFDIETQGDAELFALAIEEVMDDGIVEASDSDVQRFARKLQSRMEERDGQVGKAGSHGRADRTASKAQAGDATGTSPGWKRKSA